MIQALGWALGEGWCQSMCKVQETEKRNTTEKCGLHTILSPQRRTCNIARNVIDELPFKSQTSP